MCVFVCMWPLNAWPSHHLSLLGTNSDCSDIGALDDVLPFFSFQTDPCNLNLDINQFKVGSCNVNSLLSNNRLQQIEEILKSNNFSAFALQETKICPTYDESCFSIPGYTAYYRHRTRRGGGVIIFCKNNLISRQLQNLENDTPDLEMVCIEILCQGKRIIFSSMYRPPSSNKEHFKQNLSSTLEKINNLKPHLNLIGADMNFGGNFDFYGTLPTTPFDFEATAIFEQHLLHQICDVPTITSSVR